MFVIRSTDKRIIPNYRGAGWYMREITPALTAAVANMNAKCKDRAAADYYYPPKPFNFALPGFWVEWVDYPETNEFGTVSP